ncbi:ribbon-helix-helix protein, CopG family [Candidatus Daviesbacteria bacterium]|nr:ribbon-helix-helix protein, CopG family [Candidatus Microgenomates bacterium]MBI2334451.1 ribbon-helix-helix protein, CopG family [Candidatus Daviesbacteria bacterium]
MQTQTFNIALPQVLVKEVDKVAKTEYKNRSELIREALRRYLEDKKKWEYIFRAGRKAAREMGITSEKQINDIVYEFRHGRKP